MKKGAQGLVFVVAKTETKQKYVLKSIVIEDTKKAEFEKMIETWKVLGKSEARDYIVSYVEHFYMGKNASLFLSF
jgi:nitrate reductase assembly molybdenum cofactor insertion protein NarJ